MTYRVLPPTRRPIDRLRFLTSLVRGFFPYPAALSTPNSMPDFHRDFTC
jgi:hypothetical protein